MKLLLMALAFGLMILAVSLLLNSIGGLGATGNEFREPVGDGPYLLAGVLAVLAVGAFAKAVK